MVAMSLLFCSCSPLLQDLTYSQLSFQAFLQYDYFRQGLILLFNTENQ